MMGLITDRTQRNVYYRKELSSKGWDGMTVEERIAWMGDPLIADKVNLLPCGPYYSSSVELKYRSEEIVAAATAGGTYLYAISIIGEATRYENKTFTLSADSIVASSIGTPQLAVYWHDDNGYEYAGASLLSAGSITFSTAEWPNTNGRAYLALYVYVTTYEPVGSSDYARFGHVMLENGSTKHDYVPYVDILPTLATKGAYNYSDLNRVERAVAEISDLAGLNLVTKTNWGAWDIPTESDMSRYIGNIAKIRSRLISSSSVPLAPTTMNNLTYVEANNIESILFAAYEKAKAQGGT